jgi:isochorismate pyruvate lyase
MKKYNSLNEIRKKIDEVDIEILNLISERKDLVSEVINFKTRDQIVDKKRIDKIINRLKKEAKKKDIPNEIIIEIWMAMIQSFIKYEEKIFDKLEK